LFLSPELKYHIWSQAQGRYLFPVIAAGAAVFAPGLEITGRFPILRRLLAISIWLLVALFLFYFASECWYWLQKSLHP
jgi:hypothetical protein